MFRASFWNQLQIWRLLQLAIELDNLQEIFKNQQEEEEGHSAHMKEESKNWITSIQMLYQLYKII